MKDPAPSTPPSNSPGRGISPEWLKLPRRRCANCGKSYKPKQPLRQNQQYGFCQRQCKEQFHKHGAAFIQLKEKIGKEVARQIAALRTNLPALIRQQIQSELQVYDGDSRDCQVIMLEPDGSSRVTLAPSKPAATRASR